MNWIPIYATAVALIFISIFLGLTYKKKADRIFENFSESKLSISVLEYLKSIINKNNLKNTEIAEINSSYTNVFEESYGVFKLSSKTINSNTTTDVGLISYESAKAKTFFDNPKITAKNNLISAIYTLVSILYIPIFIFCVFFGFTFKFFQASNIILLSSTAIFGLLLILNLLSVQNFKQIINQAKKDISSFDEFSENEKYQLGLILEAKFNLEISHIFTSQLFFLTFYNPKIIFGKN